MQGLWLPTASLTLSSTERCLYDFGWRRRGFILAEFFPFFERVLQDLIELVKQCPVTTIPRLDCLLDTMIARNVNRVRSPHQGDYLVRVAFLANGLARIPAS